MRIRRRATVARMVSPFAMVSMSAAISPASADGSVGRMPPGSVPPGNVVCCNAVAAIVESSFATSGVLHCATCDARSGGSVSDPGNVEGMSLGRGGSVACPGRVRRTPPGSVRFVASSGIVTPGGNVSVTGTVVGSVVGIGAASDPARTPTRNNRNSSASLPLAATKAVAGGIGTSARRARAALYSAANSGATSTLLTLVKVATVEERLKSTERLVSTREFVSTSIAASVRDHGGHSATCVGFVVGDSSSAVYADISADMGGAASVNVAEAHTAATMMR
mmetsp:Transcript_33706/g.104056  ORF Transcript_33706/g.104056 Transcript_33706/m.104056 type:complete len:279 (-) Transcript_33706:54-890(-)